MAAISFKNDRVLLGLFAVSLALNVWLGARFLPQRTAPASPLGVGVHVADLDLQNSDGTTQVVSFKENAGPALMYVFTSTCPWCARNKPNIEAVATHLPPGYRFVPICLDCAKQTPFLIGGAPAFIKPSSATVSAFHLGPVPVTMVIATNGVVEHIWRGAFTDKIRTEVEKIFPVKLPEETRLATASINESDGKHSR